MENAASGMSLSEPWQGICLDDGSGKNVHYIDKTGKKSRNPPPNYVQELFPNGHPRYYYRGRCIRCRKETPPSFVTAAGGAFGFSINYCRDCTVFTTIGINRLSGNGDAIWAVHHDTPMHAFIDLKHCASMEGREQIHLERSKIASFEVNTLAKERRNIERIHALRQIAFQHGIGKGVLLSWGFGLVFDEYYGEVNEAGQPSGQGLKVYSDKSVYVGGWLNGLRHSAEAAHWTRPDGMRYEGTWVNDHKHGKGIQYFPDGSEYRGEFARGYEHGNGIKTYPSGARFEGRFRFGKRDGPGTLISPDNTIEKRVFKENDVMHEKAVPPVHEEQKERAGQAEGFFQPVSLLALAIQALAKTMHIKQSIVPSALLSKRLPEFFKTQVCSEYLRTMHPLGSASFLQAFPAQALRLIPHVALPHIKFQHYDAESFLYFTSSNTAIERLELVNNRLDSTSLEMLCKTIRAAHWPRLQCLNMSFNRIDVTVVQSLIGALTASAPCICSLQLAGCQITPQGGALLARYLTENPAVQELDLAFNMIQAAGAERLSEALIVNTNLTKLNLRQNNIGTLGGEALVEAMKVNLSLRELCIADNKMGAHLAGELSARLRGTTREVHQSFRASQLQVPSIHLLKQPRGKHSH